MQILNMQVFAGKNIYSHKPVIRVEVDTGELYRHPTCEMEGFHDKILRWLPGLKKHHCSLGYEGGFAERLQEGTYIPHVMEHMILELQSMMGYEVAYGKTRVLREPDIYYMVFQYLNEGCAIECARAAIRLVNEYSNLDDIQVQEMLEQIRKASIESEMGPSTKAIYQEALNRGIPVRRIGNESLLQLGYGKYARLIQASMTDAPTCIAVDMACNKHITKQILMDYNIPVPRGSVAYSQRSAAAIAEEIGYPVVVKPLDGNQGKGVTLNIQNEEQLISGFEQALKYSKAAIVEKYITGRDYRVLVVGDKVSAVSERRPPSVTGDGIRSIRQLVEMENSNPLRGDDHEKPLTRIRLDDIAMRLLARNGLSADSVPAIGEEVLLRENGNLSTGGTARDCAGEIHPFNAYTAIKAARALGLDIAGIDITAPDISVPIHKEGAVIEVNAAPGLRMHLHPTQGKASNVAADIIDMMYPPGQMAAVPIISITGTNGKTTTTRLIRHTLTLMGKKVGMTCTSGVYIGSECILKGDNTGPVSARMVLSNKEVEVAVLETARGGMVKRGLGYDMADVGVITNITEDHLGLDGIDTLEDLAFVKSLVVEAVKPGGYAVLNADDPMTQHVLPRVQAKLLLFSAKADNPQLLAHIHAGGRAVFMREGMIHVCSRKKITPLLPVEEIPITFGGMVECNIENSLAAASALYALKVPLEMIRQGLKSFKPDVVQNPGRFNVFEVGNFKVMLDYSHNTAGYNAVLRFAQRMEWRRLVGVIGMPGDRLDKHITEVGEKCGKTFSKVYIKEDNDLRSRQVGEVASLLYEAVIRAGMSKEKVEIVYSELKALEQAMLDAQPGDLIIMLYEEFEPAVELINKFRQEVEENESAAVLLEEKTVS